jgi:ammonia channel protein AmtB
MPDSVFAREAPKLLAARTMDFVTTHCLAMQPWAALIIGFTGGVVYVFASKLVHAFCGAWGLIMTSGFAHAPNVRAAYSDEVADGGHGALCCGRGA